MRIRKHAKLVGLQLSNTSLSSADPSSSARRHSPICYLNQSPWDAISFPPDSASSPYQVDGEDSFTANGSFGDSVGAVESVTSMKISADGDGKGDKINTPQQVFAVAENIETIESEGEGELVRGRIILCSKNDGKAWQCRNEVARGHTLCEHHLAQLRNYSNLAHCFGKKLSSDQKQPEKAAPIPRRRPRPKKAATAAAPPSNPYEFYYYSGFGPWRGKKRGITSGETSSINGTKPDVVTVESSPSSSSEIGREELDLIEVDGDESSEEENVRKTGKKKKKKKRVRKPIKERSLKSLM